MVKLRYHPKTLPYNILIDDAITWFEQELYRIKQAEEESAYSKIELARLRQFERITEKNIQYIKDLKEIGVKKVNVIE